MIVITGVLLIEVTSTISDHVMPHASWKVNNPVPFAVKRVGELSIITPDFVKAPICAVTLPLPSVVYVTVPCGAAALTTFTVLVFVHVLVPS